ncbi:uncharacterized protein ATNIH1004_010618 [Aspergillus tanneri]|nr:uncharacterized protein ATNIH1004_010618 [Aspergillus tanneri]KAA8643843.1 hypothetical protein ATNIH1004_010618 [Aspergillus tanneri]
MGLISRFIFVLALGLLRAFVSMADPLRPSEDPFYTPKNDSWPQLPAGTILNSRQVDIASLLPGFSSPSTAFQLLYVTRDVHDRPAHTVTTIIVPPRPNFERIISLQIAYDSPDVDCSPSFGIREGVTGPAAMWSRNQLYYLLPFLQQGPVVNVPDYEGSNAAFTVGPQAAYQTLDSIRAALKSGHITGVNSEAKTVMFGYSGGGHATEWASEFHSSYAPELNIAGAAIGGPPPNITETYLSVNGGNNSALNAWAVLGVMNAYPELEDYIHEHLLPEHKDTFLRPLKRCSGFPEDYPMPGLNLTDISAFFDNHDNFLYDFKHILDKIGVMGKHGVPKFPLYIYAGTADDIATPIEDTNSLVESFCKTGANVRYHRYWGLGHAGTLAMGMGPVWTWISNVFRGTVLPGCGRPNNHGVEEDLLREYPFLSRGGSQIPIFTEEELQSRMF